MLDLLAAKSAPSVGVERPAQFTRAAAIVRMPLAGLCAVIFLCALATPYHHASDWLTGATNGVTRPGLALTGSR